MLQDGDGLDLTQEPFGPDHCGEVGPEDLDGDSAAVFEVLGQVNRRHPALTQLPLQPVPAAEGLTQR
jgi:hypothetical protein